MPAPAPAPSPSGSSVSITHLLLTQWDPMGEKKALLTTHWFQVLESNWHAMHNRLQNAKSIDEVIQYHDFFLDKCLKECLLLLPELLKVCFDTR
ncbi:hypothetical protein Q3G72_029669 [Acer saccharum]|nr:hypothetical protein Q3G72_029669 [Acer saccharum]